MQEKYLNVLKNQFPEEELQINLKNNQYYLLTEKALAETTPVWIRQVSQESRKWVERSTGQRGSFFCFSVLEYNPSCWKQPKWEQSAKEDFLRAW